MFLKYFLYVVYKVLLWYLYYMFIICILSWIPGIHNQRWYQLLRKGSEWYLGKFGGFLVVGPIDFTPILGFLIYRLALYGLAMIINSI